MTNYGRSYIPNHFLDKYGGLNFLIRCNYDKNLLEKVCRLIRGNWGLCLDSKSQFNRGLVIAYINTLRAHIDELRVFIVESKIDFLAINESKLDNTIYDHEVCIPGFKIVRKDRLFNGRNGGGVCNYLRSNLNYRVCDDLNKDRLEN